MITRLPERITGNRYASVLPVPVPASTIRCRFSLSACSTASAICSCPRRNSYAGCDFASTPPGPKNWYSEGMRAADLADDAEEVADFGGEDTAKGLRPYNRRWYPPGKEEPPSPMSRRIHYEARTKTKMRPGELPLAGTLAIVGRPNVGKSTLFNRLVGSRRAIVGDEPGITRDRLYGEAEWAGRMLRVVDTGGIIPEDKELIPSEIFRQAKVALEQADAIVMVVDGRTELAAPDIELARQLIRMGKPLLLAVNKMDTPNIEPYAQEFRRLGIKELLPISAETGNGVAELLEHVFRVFPHREPVAETEAAEIEDEELAEA